MTKYLKASSVILLICILCGCEIASPQYIIPKEKPNIHHYSSELFSKLTTNSPYKLKIFNMNVYTYYEVDPSEPDVLLGFLESLNNDSYLDEKKENIPPKYKIIIEFEDSKYIINVFDETTVSLHPWDGIYPSDIISHNNVSDYYNLYKFCEYIEKKTKGLE